MNEKPVGIGIIGCGNISDIYFENLLRLDNVHLAACADRIPERAREKTEKWNVPDLSVDELLRHEAVEIVLNLTIPKSHARVAAAALEAGKSVYNEKPLAVTRQEAAQLIELAEKNGLRLGGAPDTFMGAGIQTCRKIIDDGWLGKPVAATAFMLCHGHETWHPDPAFYYKPGGGPMFDMGPYYLTALIALMGPVRRVTGAASSAFPERIITSAPKRGMKIEVETPTHVAGLLEFEQGAIATLVTSFDVWHSSMPPIEIYGTTGSMQVPDPNTFGGPVRVCRAADDHWFEMPLTHGHRENSRGIGVADMARAIRSGGPFRANHDLAYHVLDLMHAFHEAAASGQHVALTSTCEMPAPMPMDPPAARIGFAD